MPLCRVLWFFSIHYLRKTKMGYPLGQCSRGALGRSLWVHMATKSLRKESNRPRARSSTNALHSCSRQKFCQRSTKDASI